MSLQRQQTALAADEIRGRVSDPARRFERRTA